MINFARTFIETGRQIYNFIITFEKSCNPAERRLRILHDDADTWTSCPLSWRSDCKAANLSTASRGHNKFNICPGHSQSDFKAVQLHARMGHHFWCVSHDDFKAIISNPGFQGSAQEHNYFRITKTSLQMFYGSPPGIWGSSKDQSHVVSRLTARSHVRGWTRSPQWDHNEVTTLILRNHNLF